MYKLNNFMLSFRWTIFFGEHLMITWRNKPAKNTAWRKITNQWYFTYPEARALQMELCKYFTSNWSKQRKRSQVGINLFWGPRLHMLRRPPYPLLFIENHTWYCKYIHTCYASLIVIIVMMNCGWDLNKLIIIKRSENLHFDSQVVNVRVSVDVFESYKEWITP